jgi:predicted MFS family arabinose efflux permease
MLSHFSHHVMTALVAPLLPFIRSEFTLNYAQSGLLISAFSLTYGLSQVPGGWLADKIGPHLLILMGISGVAVTGALIGFSQSYLMLIVSLVIMGITSGGYHPSAAPLISASVEPKYQGKALGLHIVGGSTSFFLAPLIGVGLAAAWGWRGAFLGLSGPFFVFGIILFLLIRGQHVATKKPRSSSGSDERSEANTDLPRLIIVIVMTLLTRVLGGAVQAYIPLYLVDHFGVDEKTAGAFLSIIFFAGFSAAPLGGHISDRMGAYRLLIILALIQAPIVYLLVVTPFGLGFVLVLLLWGVHMFIRMPTAESFLVSHVPNRIRSTVFGFYFFAGMELSGLFTPVLGTIIDRIGFQTTFTMVSAAILTTTILMLLLLLLLGRRQSVPKAERR